jgi:hypothetical protein
MYVLMGKQEFLQFLMVRVVFENSLERVWVGCNSFYEPLPMGKNL